MPEFNQYIDIDVEEFYDEMSKREREEMLELLKQDFTIEEEDTSLPSPAGAIFLSAIDKIRRSRLQLSLEQEEMLINLAKSL
jgi:hypothetical protein